MKIASILCGLILLALVAFTWGAASARFSFFPYSTFSPFAREIYAFLVSDPNEPAISALEKLESDNGGIPYRFLQREALPFETAPGFSNFEIDADGILMRGYHDPEIFPGYFLVSGAFNFDIDRNEGTILISTDGTYLGGWPHQQYNDVNPTIDVERKKFLISGKYSVDWDCDIGDLTRELGLRNFGVGHHGATKAPDGTYWTHEKHDLIQYDPEQIDENGKFQVLRRIGLGPEMLEHNPLISPTTARFSIRWDDRLDPLKIAPKVGYVFDPFHNNDVEPIVSKRFPTELGYALLVSVREQNLILVIDPDTKKILWYRQGLTERQHDPDFFEDGIYVYNNRTFSGNSRIEYIPFESDGSPGFGMRTVIDGGDHGWFDPSRGQHSVFERDGIRNHLVVNDRNGRILVFDEEGRIIFEAINILSGQDDERTRLQLRTALYLDEETYSALTSDCS